MFGMGTGGSAPPLTTEEEKSARVSGRTIETRRDEGTGVPGVTLRRPYERGGASAISPAWLQRLPAVHRPAIEPVVFRWPYLLGAVGDLILGGASRLDAFSASPQRA